jgi:predicted ABC-type ATPase
MILLIIDGQNGVGKSTLLYALKQSILENVVKNEDVIFVSPFSESDRMKYAHAHVHGDESSTRIASVLSRLEIARRNIIAASCLLDDKNRSPIAAYTSISHVYEPRICSVMMWTSFLEQTKLVITFLIIR